MSREDGFPIADVSVRLMSDSKVVALARRHLDSAATYRTIGIYVAVLTASWGEGRRLTAEEALPAWDLSGSADAIADLAAVGLLDDETRLPVHAFEGWIGPARERRESARERGRKGGMRAHGKRSKAEVDRILASTAKAEPKQSYSTGPSGASPDRPASRPAVLPAVSGEERSEAGGVIGAGQAPTPPGRVGSSTPFNDIANEQGIGRAGRSRQPSPPRTDEEQR